ncbi:MAG: hypothetical protein NC926_10235 [Candidatus Omnitrophica bacterium]|nr:hypothetical protein [Candidatus Omnitrophota bacterium]
MNNNDMKEVEKLKLVVRRLKANSSIVISADIKPVEIYDYKSCLTARYVFRRY